MEAKEFAWVKIVAVKGIVTKADAKKMGVKQPVLTIGAFREFKNQERAMNFIKEIESKKLSKSYMVYILTDEEFVSEKEGKFIKTI